MHLDVISCSAAIQILFRGSLHTILTVWLGARYGFRCLIQVQNVGDISRATDSRKWHNCSISLFCSVLPWKKSVCAITVRLSIRYVAVAVDVLKCEKSAYHQSAFPHCPRVILLHLDMHGHPKLDCGHTGFSTLECGIFRIPTKHNSACCDMPAGSWPDKIMEMGSHSLKKNNKSAIVPNSCYVSKLPWGGSKLTQCTAGFGIAKVRMESKKIMRRSSM